MASVGRAILGVLRLGMLAGTALATPPGNNESIVSGAYERAFNTTRRTGHKGGRRVISGRLGQRVVCGVMVLALMVASFLVLGGDTAMADDVSCGDTITTDTKLDRDLIDCPNNGIIIGADNITLDLDGHTIDGDSTSVTNCPQDEFCDVGIANDGHKGITVKDGTIRGFDVGVFVFRASDNRLHGLQASANSFVGMVVSESTESRIANNSANHNGSGVQGRPGAVGRGIILFGSHDVSITRNSASRNDIAGIDIFESHDIRITKNKTSGNEIGMGIELNDNHISRNRSRNDGFGILVAGNGNVITRNHVARSPSPGIQLEGGGIHVAGNGNVITRNHVARSPSPGSGIQLDGGHDNLIARNVVVRSSEAGIRLVAFEGETAPTVDNVVLGNRVRGAHDGFLIESTATDTLLEGNRAVRNSDDGIDVNSPATTLTRNLAVQNGDLGIEAVPGVVDGDGNKARGNGDPRQCTNVDCGP